MTEPLRPMSTGELLDRTFSLYRKNFLLFVGIAALGPAANVIFQLLTVGANVTSPFGLGRAAARPVLELGTGVALAATMFFGYIILVAGMALSTAATVKAVAAVHLGREISIVNAYKTLCGRILSVFGTVILIALLVGAAMVGLIIVFVVPAVLLSPVIAKSMSGPSGAVLGAIFSIVVVGLTAVLTLMVYIRYAVAIQACVVEALGPRASMRRSVFLTKGGRWRVVAVYLVFLLLGIILGLALAGLAGAAGALMHNKIAAAVLVYLAGFVVGSITGPLATIGLSLLYYDERVRKEAFDLQLMMSSLDTPAPAQTLAAPAQA
jgi:hypothetical protein